MSIDAAFQFATRITSHLREPSRTSEHAPFAGQMRNSGKFERLLSPTVRLCSRLRPHTDKSGHVTPERRGKNDGYFAADVTGGLANPMVLSSGVFLWGWRALASSAHFWSSSSKF